MGYKKCCGEEPYPFDTTEYRLRSKYVCIFDDYNPYNDINQRASVFDILFNEYFHNKVQFTHNVIDVGLDKATRDFIISTMEDSDK